MDFCFSNSYLVILLLLGGNSANQDTELLIQKGVPESHIIFLNLISLKKDFTSDDESAVASLRGFSANKSSSRADLTLLFRAAAQEAKTSREQIFHYMNISLSFLFSLQKADQGDAQSTMVISGDVLISARDFAWCQLFEAEP